MSACTIRRAEERDLPALLAIYNHYITKTAITFCLEPYTLADYQRWFEKFSITGRYQCFVADDAGVAVGWACSSPFRPKDAYLTSIETSIYLAPGYERQGLGTQLYAALFHALSFEDVHRIYGVVTMPNEASKALHLNNGFAQVGLTREVGRKFGRFWDVAWFERANDPRPAC